MLPEVEKILKKEIIATGAYTVTVGSVLTAVLIFVVTFISVKLLSAIIKRALRKKGQPDGRHISIIQLVQYFIWIIAITFILQSLGINITFLVASSAALLVGVGLGLQNVFKDFVSGIVLLIEGKVQVNDIVELDGQVVQVNEISLRTSKVTTRDDNVVIIPNHMFVEEKIVNWTNNMQPTRFMIEVGVDYSSDINLVDKTLVACANAHPDVLKDETYKPTVRLYNFGGSSIDFQLVFYSYNLFRIEMVKSQIRFEIARAFNENNIVIPFSQLVIRQAK